MIDDIIAKGAAGNYDARPNEGTFQMLRMYYQQTNHKKAEKQVQIIA